MPYVCPTCGDCNSFKGIRGYTERGTERIYFDRDEDITDYGDRDSHDSDYDGAEEIECQICDETALYVDDVEEWCLENGFDETGKKKKPTEIKDWKSQLEGENDE